MKSFISGDTIKITGKNIKEKYRGMVGQILRWHHDNVYTVYLPMTHSPIEIVLKADEMELVLRG